MAGRKSIKTTKEEIVNYWVKHIDESDLSVDFREADKRCWRCGCKRKLQRCHIVPDSLGGKDEPSNLVLLCSRCHLDNPNVSDPDIMWDWLKSYKVPFYDTFWKLQGFEEYKKIYGKSMEEEYRIRGITKNNIEEIQEIFQSQLKKASYHFGDRALNVATLAGIYRMTLKEYDLRYGFKMIKEVKPYINMGKYL